jgi:hypothetical protein
MNFILSLDTDTFIDLVNKAIENDTNEMLWNKWLHNGINEMSFDEYKAKHTPQQSKNEEDVLQDAENILKSMSKPK